jgi:hypothetical protein
MTDPLPVSGGRPEVKVVPRHAGRSGVEAGWVEHRRCPCPRPWPGPVAPVRPVYQFQTRLDRLRADLVWAGRQSAGAWTGLSQLAAHEGQLRSQRGLAGWREGIEQAADVAGDAGAGMVEVGVDSGEDEMFDRGDGVVEVAGVGHLARSRPGIARCPTIERGCGRVDRLAQFQVDQGEPTFVYQDVVRGEVAREHTVLAHRRDELADRLAPGQQQAGLRAAQVVRVGDQSA